MKPVCCAAIVFLAVAGSVFGQQPAITVAQAKSLARLVLQHERLKFPTHHCAFELLTKDGDPFIPNFYSLSAACDYPKTPATTPLGIYIVSPRTGEVWRFDECKPFAFPKLLNLRKKLLPTNPAAEQAEAKYRSELGCYDIPVIIQE